jgi:hypothetical protein
VATFAAHAYNYMQFRTSSGGFEAGSATLDAQANVSASSYTGNSQQDVFVTFVDRAVLFSSFKTALPLSASNPYDYLYGVGLK